MFGWLLIGSTLIVRGILPLRLSSLWHVLRMSVPSVIALFLIFWLAFKGDADRFRGELFAAPEPWRMIEHPSKVGENLRIFTDGDAPIWLGSAFDDGRNTLYHWRRTPAELLEAVIGYFKRVDGMNHVAAYLALLTIAGISVAFAGPSNFRRKVGVLSVYFLVFSYAPMLLSQDHSAYRRGMYTEVTMMLLITGAFAALGRLNQKVPLAIVPAVGLALIKAPLELQPLFTDEMHTPMCVMCHSEAGVPLKRLVTDPQFVALQSRSLRFLVNPSDVAELQSSCMEMALQSWEMSKLVPLGKMIEGVPGDLMATYQQLNPGDILVLLCTRGERAHIRNPDLIAACDGESRIGRILGRTQPESWVWFTFIEKTMS
jgi:energy-coupling factor transporter transmembrane protein EcfT